MSESTSKESVTKWEVQTSTFCDGWINVWTWSDEDNDAVRQLFDTPEEAQAAIDEFIQDTKDSPDVEDYDPEDYRVVEVTVST